MLNTVGRLIIIIIIIIQEKICFALPLVRHRYGYTVNQNALHFFRRSSSPMFHVSCGCNSGRMSVIALNLRCTFFLLHSLLFVYFVTYQKLLS